jgi:hypothetical protein
MVGEMHGISKLASVIKALHDSRWFPLVKSRWQFDGSMYVMTTAFDGHHFKEVDNIGHCAAPHRGTALAVIISALSIASRGYRVSR